MTQIVSLEVGNTRTPIGSLLMQGGKPVDLTGKTVKFQLWDSTNTVKQAETATGVTAHPTATFTADATNDWLVCSDHKAKNGMQVVVSTTTTLPGGLAASTRYFVVNATENNFQLATTHSGGPIDITSAGSGTHSFYIVGSVQYQQLSADVDTEGRFNGWWTVYEGATFDTFPADEEGIVVNVFGAN